MNDWYQQFTNMGMHEAAQRLGIQNKGKSKRYGPCPNPACSKDRSEKDPRPPLAFFIGNREERWHCYVCKIGGNIFDLVSFSTYGKAAAALDNFSDLRQWIGSTPAPTHKYEIPVRKEPSYPPADEVRRLVLAATRIAKCSNAKIREWCKSRGLDIDKIPAGVCDPAFDCGTLTQVETSRGRISPWWPSIWRKEFNILIPMVDFQGNLASVLGRTTYGRRRKSSVPISFSTRNLLFACTKARRFLQREETPEKIWITEGEIDYLTIAQLGQPVIGIRSGSLDAISLMKWQEHQSVFIATDNDEAGERYATQIAEKVYPACPRRIRLDMLGGRG